MDRPRGLHPALAIAVVVALVALLVSILAFNTRAAGGGEEGGDGAPPPAAAEVAVTQSEFAFAPSAISVPEGGIVEITNEGTIAHNFKVREREDEFATPDIQPGDAASLELHGPAGGRLRGVLLDRRPRGGRHDGLADDRRRPHRRGHRPAVEGVGGALGPGQRRAAAGELRRGRDRVPRREPRRSGAG